jgi:transposase
LHSTFFPPIPVDTAKAAQAVFGRSNFYMLVGDQANSLLLELIQDDPKRREWKSDRSLGRLYLITIFQFVETLPDHLAIDALRERVDWKYALHLPMNNPGLELGSFCEFRKWLNANDIQQQKLELLFMRLSHLPVFNGLKRSSLQSNQITTFVCQISRLGKIWEAFNQSLEALAIIRPEWLLSASLAHWYECYGRTQRNLNLRSDGLELHAFAQAIGADGHHLLAAISASGDPELANLAEIATLRRVWGEEFEAVEREMIWRKEACASCAITRRN